VVKFVRFKSAKFSHILVVNELICFILVLVAKDEWMTKMHSMRLKVTYWKDRFDLLFGLIRNIFAKQDRYLFRLGD